MIFVRHIVGVIYLLMLSVLSAMATPMAASASLQLEFYPAHQAHTAEHTDVHVTARAPPVAVTNVANTGEVTALHGGAVTVHGYETHVVSLDFRVGFEAPNNGLPEGYRPLKSVAGANATSADLPSGWQRVVDPDGNVKISSSSGRVFDVGFEGGATLNNLSPADITRIQNAAERIGVPITVVGSRAGGTASGFSDWDFVFPPGTSNRTIRKVRNSLPQGVRDGLGGDSTTDFFVAPIQSGKPALTFNPVR